MTHAKNKEIVLYAVGDVGPNRENPQSIFRHVSGILKQGDIQFCQLETNLSIRGTPLPQARLPMRTHPNAAHAIKDCHPCDKGKWNGAHRRWKKYRGGAKACNTRKEWHQDSVFGL